VIAVGEVAPDFTLKTEAGKRVTLSELRGKRVLLVFYPKDFSPVCSDQLTLYKEIQAQLDEAGVDLYGVSVDHTWAHAAFKEKLGLDFTLLADFHPRGEMSDRYGAYLADYGTTNRSLVLIGADGVVEWVHEAETPLEIPPAEVILEAL
jgi:peroxiredoxin